jgi:hypothetical protein
MKSKVLTPVNIKITVFWEVKPCNPVDFHRRFGGTYYLHIQGWRCAKQAGGTNKLTKNLFIWCLFNVDSSISDNINFKDKMI